MLVVERFPGEACSAKFFEKRFVSRRFQDAQFYVTPEKQHQRGKSMQRRTAVECVRVEVTRDDCGTIRKRIQKKPHLPGTAKGSSKNFQMGIGYGQNPA